MNRRTWLWASVVVLPLAVASGFVYATVHAPQTYICPLTGEELPCPARCPLNQCEPQQSCCSSGDEK
jgi:hypothetical protein